MQTKQFKIDGLKVLEIGCGQGILGVYLAKEFSCQVTCNDIDEHVLPIVDLHADLNGVTVKTKKCSLADLDHDFLGQFDLIIGSEICYSESIAQEIISLFTRYFNTGVGQILIADPGRPDFFNCIEYCQQNYTTELFTLPGSINGKVTTLLSVVGQK